MMQRDLAQSAEVITLAQWQYFTSVNVALTAAAGRDKCA